MPRPAVGGNNSLIVRDENDPTLDDLENARLAKLADEHARRLRFEHGLMTPEEADEYVASGARGTGR